MLTSRLIDRPIRPLFPTRLVLRDADRRAADLGRRRERLGRAGDHRRLGGAGALVDSRSRRRSPACASAWSTAQLRHQPDLPRAQEEQDRPGRGRQRRRDHDGRGGREGSDRRRDDRRARRRARGDQADRRRDRRPEGASAARRRRPSPPRQIGHEFYREVEEKAYVPLAEAMRIKDKLENYAQRRRGARRARRVAFPEDEVERRSDAKTIFKELKEKVMRDEILERGQRLDGRRFDEIRPIWIETRRAAARPRLGRVHARRDAGARQRHARHRRRRAEDRDGRGRDLQALHAPLQLPAVLGRRSAVPARPRPARSRPRRARRARARAAAARPRKSSPTPSASSPTSSSPTARRRWRRSAAARSR